MLTDGHCHPTDTPEKLHSIRDAPLRMAIMSTRFDDLDLVAEQSQNYPDKVVPAFGIHPWYSHLLIPNASKTKIEHYQAVLEPAPEADDPIIDELPEPVLLDEHIQRIQKLLDQHPTALVGEVGLDKAFKVKVNGTITKFKVSMAHQQQVLHSQLQLACKLQRSVSMHCVQAPQPLYDEVARVLAEEESPMGNICLHSYAGSAEFLRDYWNKRLDCKVFVSIAVLINGKMQPGKLKAMLNATTPETVLSESDYHSAGPEQVDLVRKSVAVFADYFGWSLEDMETQLEKNFNSFVTPQFS